MVMSIPQNIAWGHKRAGISCLGPEDVAVVDRSQRLVGLARRMRERVSFTLAEVEAKVV